MIKISQRDSSEAVSIYFSGTTSRAMNEAAKMYKGYNNRKDKDHESAIEFVIRKIMPLIESSSRAHSKSSASIIKDLKNMISEGLS